MNIKLDYSDVKFQNNGKLKLLIIVGTRPEIIRLAAVIQKCRRYFDTTGRRISFEYTLISGKNDSVEAAVKLASVLKKYMKDGIHVNLIPLNEVAEREYKRGRNEDIKRFCDTLGRYGINATVRRRLGPDINASCGQLRRNSGASAQSE